MKLVRLIVREIRFHWINFTLSLVAVSVAVAILVIYLTVGEAYRKEKTVTYMLEVTYRKNDLLDSSSDQQIIENMIEGLIKIGFIEKREDVNFTSLKRFPFAYVIYDLFRYKNLSTIIQFLRSQGIYPIGRYGLWEYATIEEAILQGREVAQELS